MAIDGDVSGAKVEVRWPSGRQTEIWPLEVRRSYRLIEP
jgi:hypothetical protein